MKRFIRNLLVLLLLAFGVTAAYRSAAPYFEKTFGTTNPLPYLTFKMQQLVAPQKVQEIDHQDTDGDHTFSRNTATVYLNLNNPTLRNASITGLNAWNNTGAFNFQLTNNKKDAQIVIQAMDDSSTNAAGLTSTEYNSLTNHLLHATVRLNSFYLLNPNYGYSNNRIVNTVEHELGHAIGLSHSNGVSVMYPQGSFYTIQPSDIQNVKKLYHENSK